VLVGAVPLLKVQTYVVTEGYKSAAIAGSSFVQMVGLATKTIAIDALLVGAERALRPALEAMALNPLLLGALGALGSVFGLFPSVGSAVAGALPAAESVIGIPVVSKNFIHLDMQITQLKFTQDNQSRETLSVHIELTNVPRAKLGALIGAGTDVALGVGAAFF
jgi:hypothetical protein